MQLAQMLYEGVETSEGHRAFITYMRTDSTRISDYARDQAEKFIKAHFGERYVGEFSSKQKKSNVQDAHEAIRPVDVEMTPQKAQKLLDRDLYKLYKLIWERFVASQMAAALYEETIYTFESGKYGFEAKLEKRIFDGFEAVLKKESEEVEPLKGRPSTSPDGTYSRTRPNRPQGTRSHRWSERSKPEASGGQVPTRRSSRPCSNESTS